jgi:COMPASS component SPP1
LLLYLNFRLRILCPEHSKDPKIVDDEVCGCPLVSQSSPFEHSGKFCRVLKKKCNKHHCWEKLRRAELDAERIQQWLKLDDLFEREQKIRYCMANRHGILGLMLHQTIVHDDNETNPLI